MLCSKCPRSRYRETRRIFFNKEARYKRQRRRIKEENKNGKRERVRKRSAQDETSGLSDLFLQATWFGQVFNLFPLRSRRAYELLCLAWRNGDGPSRITSPSIRAPFVYHRECIANDSHVTWDFEQFFSYTRYANRYNTHHT